VSPRYGKLASSRSDTPKGDILISIYAILLTLIGLAYLYSATYVLPDAETGASPFLGISRFLVLQVVWFILGLAAYRVISRADFTVPPFHWLALYIPLIFLLLLTLLVGMVVGGSQRWIDLGFVRVQPSEYAKLGYALVVAHLFTQGGKLNWDRFWLAFGLLGVAAVLIFLQPDLGTALVFTAILAIQLFVSEKGKRFLLAFAFVLVTVAIVGWNFVLHDYQKERVMGFVSPSEEHKLDRDWQATQSSIAIGSGGLFGKGFRQGTQTHGGFVPSDHTDFIFSVIAEESGFVGSAMVILLFLLLIQRLIWVAEIAGNEYQRLIAYGISAIIFFQAMVNIGMNLGVMPITGIPLPFISYGGNSLLMLYISLGICQSIVRNRSRVSL
jgi:rod shape determining protein RodA